MKSKTKQWIVVAAGSLAVASPMVMESAWTVKLVPVSGAAGESVTLSGEPTVSAAAFVTWAPIVAPLVAPAAML